MIKHFKSLDEMRKNIGNIVKNILSKSVFEAFRPVINTFRKACGIAPIPEPPKQEKMSFGKAIVKVFKFLLSAIITPSSFALKIENDKKFQQELENEINNYMKNNKEICNNIIYNNITSAIKHIVDLIELKAKSVADKKLKDLKNRVSLYQVSNIKINPKIITLVPQHKTTNSSSNSQETQRKSENLKNLNELSKLYQQCMLVKDFMTDAQKKELDEIKKTIDNEYKLINNK